MVPDRGGEVMPRLAAACPSFVRPMDAAGPYMEAWALARHVVDLVVRDETADLAPEFGEVEALYELAAPGVDEVLTVGVIESLQNVAAEAGPDVCDRLRPWLGPLTAAAWDRVNAHWGGPRTHPDGRVSWADPLRPKPDVA